MDRGSIPGSHLYTGMVINHLKIFTIWPFTKVFPHPWLRSIMILRLGLTAWTLQDNRAFIKGGRKRRGDVGKEPTVVPDHLAQLIIYKTKKSLYIFCFKSQVTLNIELFYSFISTMSQLRKLRKVESLQIHRVKWLTVSLYITKSGRWSLIYRLWFSTEISSDKL